MVEVITFPDTTLLVTDYLADNMAEPVLPRIPDPRPAEFVLVRRTGGPKRNLVTDQAQITVESFGSSDEDAHDIAQEARALLNALPGQIINGVPVYRVDELSGPANFPDPVSNQARYTQSFSVAARGAVSGS